MNIHEHQAKQLLTSFGIKTPQGVVIDSPIDLKQKIDQALVTLDSQKVWVVKAQIHAGGRGKAGGVKICKSKQQVESETLLLMGKTLITAQTGPQGKQVNRILIEQGLQIAKEFYLSVALDRSRSEVIMLASTEGGVEIEHIAATQPEKITQIAINPTTGFMPFHGRQLAYALGLGSILKEAISFFGHIYECYNDLDCSLLEINPLVLTTDNTLIALDAKCSFDDNSLYRQPKVLAMRDITEENPQDVEAAKYDLAYIALSGNIGCLVNGAGLAMATMDIIKLHGGDPANFLDVGGGASKEKVAHAFKIILKDPSVKAILVNIFGGIMKCDVIAEGIIAAAQELALKVPLVVRLQGTNVEQGKKILANSGLRIIAAESLSDAAQKVVAATKQ